MIRRTIRCSDAVAVLVALVSATGAAAQTCNADLNGDGVVDGKDLAMIISAWGGCPVVISSITPLQGSVLGGTEITINGSGLSTLTAVTVGGAPCTNVTVVSPRQIRATTPPGQVGSAEIVVTAAGGSESAAEEFTYMQQVITSIFPSAGHYSGGSLITISGSYLGGTTGVTFGGVPATSVEVIDATTVRAVTPAGSVGTVDVVVVGTKGTVTVPGGFLFVDTTIPSWATLIEAQPDPAVVYDAGLRAAISATGLAWRVLDTATQIEMVLVPPGTFMMGCISGECGGLEVPVHQVTLTEEFYLGRYEVTQAQWQARMGSNPSWFQESRGFTDTDERPVERVSRNMVLQFMLATGLRLPTEAEWEYACRAGTTSSIHSMPGFPEGTEDLGQIGVIAWYPGNVSGSSPPSGGTQTVGSRAPNALGLHDMSGNVWEFVSDWGGPYTADAQTNPTGPASNPSGVGMVRGGSWAGSISSTFAHRSYDRDVDLGVGWSSVDGGFRVARNP